MSQTTYRPGNYIVPCPRCAAGIRLARRGDGSQRTTCRTCGNVLVTTWMDATILLASYPEPGRGKNGKDGREGRNRTDAQDGRNGKDGKDAQDGKGNVPGQDLPRRTATTARAEASAAAAERLPGMRTALPVSEPARPAIGAVRHPVTRMDTKRPDVPWSRYIAEIRRGGGARGGTRHSEGTPGGSGTTEPQA